MAVTAMKKKKVLALPQRSHEAIQQRIRERAYQLFEGRVGNPVEGERDSGLKPNTIPL